MTINPILPQDRARQQAADVIADLRALPARIESAERKLIQAQAAVAEAREALDAETRQLLLSEQITGKNAEIRAAQLESATVDFRRELQRRERNLDLLKVDLHRVQADFAAARAIARLLEGGQS